MREHLVAENSVRNLRCVHQVHLEQTSLQWSLFGLVVLERVEQEGCRRLDHVLRHEDVHDLVSESVHCYIQADDRWSYPFNVDQRTRLVSSKLSGELRTLLRVRSHDVLQQSTIIRRVSDLLGVQENLLGLPKFRETGDDFVRYIGPQVYAERQSHVVKSNNVAELFAASKLKDVFWSAVAQGHLGFDEPCSPSTISREAAFCPVAERGVPAQESRCG